MTSTDDVFKMHVLVPRWVRDLVVEAAEREGLSISAFCSGVMLEAARGSLGIPKPPPAVARVPTVQEVLRRYVDGEGGRLIGPCGERWPCGYGDVPSSFLGDGVEFCGKCSVRVN